MVHGPWGGSAVAVRGPAGYGAAAVRGPAGGVVAGYRGPFSSGVIATLPSGYACAAWRGTNYYHSGYSFYHPYMYGGTLSYMPVYPPTGWFFGALAADAVQTVVNDNSYYYSDGVHYQPGTQNGQQGYTVVEPPSQAVVPQQISSAGGAAPDPLDLLRRMSEHLGSQKQIEIMVSETFDEVTAAGQKTQLSNERTIHVRRPDKVAVDVRGAGVHRQITYDGSVVTVVDLMKNVYATIAMSGSLDVVMDKIAKEYGMAQPVEDLLYGDIYSRLSAKIKSG